MVIKIIADRAKGILVLTQPSSEDAHGNILRSNIDSIALNELVFAPYEEMFMDDMGSPLWSPGRAYSTLAYYVDGTKSHPCGDEALIQRIQGLPMRVMFELSNDCKVEVNTLSLDEMGLVV